MKIIPRLAVAVLSLAIILPAIAQSSVHFPPRTIEELHHLPFSGALYNVMARNLSDKVEPVRNPAAQAVLPAEPGRRGFKSSTERLPYRAAPDSISTTNIDNDSALDVEPTIIRQTNSSGTASIIVHTKFASATSLPENNYYTNKSGGPYTGQFTVPTNYTWSGDPFLAENQLDSGQSPRRVYLAGEIGDNTATRTGVALWYSDNLGQSWTLSSNLVASSSVSTTVIDKPTCDVSFYTGSAGYLYVSYTKVIEGNTSNTYEIHCARSTDGGASFDQDVTVASSSTNILESATVVVGSGYIYVIWVDYTASPQKIYEGRSPSTGTLAGTWSVDSSGPTGYFFLDETDHMNGELRGRTIPMVRFNWAATKISIVWHEKEASGSHLADVYYAAKGSGGWQSKVKISNESACSLHTDQFMPALDFDSNGNMIVTYYDRQDDCSNLDYYEYYTKIDSTGSQLQAPAKVNTFASDPTENTFLAGTPSEYRFIGDYQEVWGDGGSPITWHSAWIGAPVSGSSDCNYSQIQ